MVNYLTICIFNLDLHEAGHLCAAYGALVRLHPHNLRALNTQTHVPARKHDRVLGRRETHYTLTLGLICYIRCCVIDAIDIIELEDRIVILSDSSKIAYQEFLLKEFELKVSGAFLSELSVCYLNRFACPSRIIWWVDSLNSYNNRIIVLFQSCQIFTSVHHGIDHAHFLRELLLQT